MGRTERYPGGPLAVNDFVAARAPCIRTTDDGGEIDSGASKIVWRVRKISVIREFLETLTKAI
jgi:hypothetical protein